ncbi:myosinI binding protein, putative [Acanthamoeba castellanii str. Neff]|uniref:MyosinI binding protein, putative n=1 Tax=Acanthamoeba castellanii (strain ATCC 30010 / Neff) TaxID=1257118 RepID=L8GRB9_ACACF|nr:myosinI binding protein, putative [Acanthamoeba castellanii str. Neff]ELR15193.1 myosinI binding protein, putative [Acanthamoeba castellanii str. Neff]
MTTLRGTTSFTESVASILGQRKDELQYVGWVAELVKKKAEERVVVVGKWRIYFFSLVKGAAKLLRDAHLLELKEIKSTDSTTLVELVFKTFSVPLGNCAADDLITAIRQSYEDVFFNLPPAIKCKLNVTPESRLRDVEGPAQATLAKNCGGFSGTYQALCDFYGIPVRADICWDMDNLLPANHVKKFNMKEFEQPVTPNELKALVDTLHFNNYFIGFVARDYRLDKDSMKVLTDMIGVNTKMEELAIAKNRNSALTSIDWSNNLIKDAGVAALAAAVASMGHGLTSISLKGGDATKKGTVALCTAFKKNVEMSRTLTVLNLAGNKLDSDGTSALAAFVSGPNALQTLNISGTAANLEMLLPAVMRGCTELEKFNISHNKVTAKTGPELKKFLQSCGRLSELHMRDTAVPVQVVRDVIKAIIGNNFITDFQLDLAANKLGVLGANMLAGLAAEITTIKSLDLTDNDFGDEGMSIIADGLCHNSSLRELHLGDNWTRNKTKARSQAVDNLIELISSECPLHKLDLSCKVADNQIKTDILPFIYSLATNDTLKELDISGNAMGDKGGIALGKAFQINRTLKSLIWDRNGTRYAGFLGLKNGLERNNVLVNMPVPVFDISDLLKNEKPESALQVQQVVLHISEYIARNQSPKSKFAQGEDFSQHISLMGTGAQEEVQKLRQRIRAGQEEFTPGQAAVLKDAEENDNRIAAMQRIQDEVQQALADEVASKLGQFASQLVPFLASTHDQLIDRVVDQVKEYKGFEKSAVEKLKMDLKENAKTSLSKDAINKILAKSAASEITSEMTQGFVSSVSLTVDFVFDSLLDKLDSIYYSQKGGAPTPRSQVESAESLPETSTADDTPSEASEEEPNLASESSETSDLPTTTDAAAAAEEAEPAVSVPARPTGVPMGGVALPFGAMRTGMPAMPMGGVVLRPTGSPLSQSATDRPKPVPPPRGAKPAPPPRTAKPLSFSQQPVLMPKPELQPTTPTKPAAEPVTPVKKPEKEVKKNDTPAKKPEKDSKKPEKPAKSPKKPEKSLAKSKEPEPASADMTELEAAESNLTHMTKDRPMGPQRRRPQRKPQRRPMMSTAD